MPRPEMAGFTLLLLILHICGLILAVMCYLTQDYIAGFVDCHAGESTVFFSRKEKKLNLGSTLVDRAYSTD